MWFSPSAFAALVLGASATSGKRSVVAGPQSFVVKGSVEITGASLEPNHLWRGPNISVLSTSQAVLVVRAVPEPSRVLCVVDGRAVLNATAGGGQWACNMTFLSFGGMHIVAAYGVAADGRIALIGDPVYLRRDVDPASNSNSSSSSTERRVAKLRESQAALALHTPPRTATIGTYYTTYLNPLAQLYQNMTRVHGSSVTMEGVLRNTSLRFADSVWGPGPAAAGAWWQAYAKTCDIMHQTPALGMYCLYEKRANESVGPIPDCPETAAVLAAHAAELTAAGFEWVAPDATNWDGDPRNQPPDAPSSDFYQLRPTEVIAAAWAAARLGGAAAPQLSIFAKVGPGGDLWRWYLSELFNNATLLDLDLVYRVAGKKVFIAADLGPTGTNYSTLTDIAANGGADDVVTPLMWFAPNASGAWEASGRLAYESRCIARHVDTGVVDFSYDAWIDPAVPCAHLKTPASPIGSSWTVSTGLPINSVPFGAVRFNGLLLKKQWWDVLADDRPTDMIFAPSWNEFGSRAYSLPGKTGATNPAFYAVGAAADDPDRFSLFEDGYGMQRSRTIEPSVEDGGRYYEAFASCVRVYRLQAALGVVGDGTGCAVAGEDCCAVAADESFAHVWSLDRPAANASVPADSLLSSDAGEVRVLEAAGCTPVCVPTIYGRGPTAVCVDPALPFQYGAAGVDAASRGPFVLYANATGEGLPAAVPLVRCASRRPDGSIQHLVTNATDGCAKAAAGFAFDVLLGYGQAHPDSLFARPVRRCSRQHASSSAGSTSLLLGTWFYTVVNVPCLAGDADDGLLLYAV